MANSETEGQDRTNRRLKVVLLGDGTTGKTSIATRLAQNDFDKSYHQTLGVDFFLRRMELPGGVNVALQVWDIGGQTIGGQMLDTYIFGADAVLLIYDITNYSSFENLRDWLKEVNRVSSQSDHSPPHLALVANKTDLEALRTVKREKHNTFCSQNNMSSYFISAKTDDLVMQCLMQVAANALNITLTHKDLDTSNKVVKAEIKPATDSSSVVQSKRNKNSRTASAICAIQ